jgi:hypothetical protein
MAAVLLVLDNPAHTGEVSVKTVAGGGESMLRACRSPVTRAAFIIFGLFAAYGLSPLGFGTWRSSPALQWLHSLIPYPAMVAVLAVYCVCAAWRRTFPVACMLGIVIYGTYGVALTITLWEGRTGSPVAVAACGLTVTFHYLAWRLAVLDPNTHHRDKP